MATLPVKWYHSFMRGFPVIAGVAGNLITALDAVLVNGFGQVTAASAKIDSGYITINLSNNETFEKYSVVELLNNPLVNGEYRVLESTNTYIKVKTDLSNQVLTGTLYVKYAPLGWTKITPSQANKALYVPKTSFSGFNIYVNDNYRSCAEVRLCRGAIDNSTIPDYSALIDPVPLTASNTSSYWVKSYNNNTTRFTAHFIIGDPSTLYFQWGLTHTYSLSGLRKGKICGCGDIIRYSEDDDLAAFLTTGTNTFDVLDYYSNKYSNQSMQMVSTQNINYSDPINTTFLGNHLGVKGNDFAGRIPENRYGTQWSGYNDLSVYQSLNNKGLELSKLLAVNLDTVRGEYPGIYFIPFKFSSTDDMIVEEGSGSLAGRLIMLKCAAAGNASHDDSTVSDNSIVAFDITGPWR